MELNLNKTDKFIPRKGPLLTIIMDGVGVGKHDKSDGVFVAKTPCLDKLFSSDLFHYITGAWESCRIAFR